MNNTELAMSEALDAIHDQALRILNLSGNSTVDAGLELIIALSRYKHDLRTDEEIKVSSDSVG